MARAEGIQAVCQLSERALALKMFEISRERACGENITNLPFLIFAYEVANCADNNLASQPDDLT
jgi:hypothetical protein